MTCSKSQKTGSFWDTHSHTLPLLRALLLTSRDGLTEKLGPRPHTCPVQGPRHLLIWPQIFVKFAKIRHFYILFLKESPPDSTEPGLPCSWVYTLHTLSKHSSLLFPYFSKLVLSPFFLPHYHLLSYPKPKIWESSSTFPHSDPPHLISHQVLLLSCLKICPIHTSPSPLSLSWISPSLFLAWITAEPPHWSRFRSCALHSITHIPVMNI